ncbi:hypothetical protein D9M69_623920 [compost metagenome]
MRWLLALANSVRFTAASASALSGTRNGLSLMTVWRQKPLATRRLVLATRRSSMIDLPRSLKSMHSAAGRQGSWPFFGFSWRFGSGQMTGRPSVRPTMKRRLRMVGAPALEARRSRHSTFAPRPRTSAALGTHWPIASRISGRSG